MPVCASCGQENPDGFRFCGGCGAGLAAEPLRAREERKVVTVLFCDLVGFTQRSEQMDPEDVRAVLSRYHAHLREELERFGGTVERFIGDAVVAVFGASVAREDDPERAVRAALAVRDWACEEDGLELRVAVNTGEALVALSARPEQGEGMVAGDVVNTAARLQSAAPVNGILVRETTGAEALPESVQGIIAARLDTLPRAEKELVQDASVLGGVFWLGALGAERWTLEERLHALERRELVRRERRRSVAGESECAFRHALVRDVAYEQMPRALRAEKHRLAAEWIESLGKPQDHAETLAHHYLRALEYGRAAGLEVDGLVARARTALRAAGDRAVSLSAFASAARLYEAALELASGEEPDDAGVLLGLGTALQQLADERAEPVLERAAESALVAGDPASAAEACVLLAELSWHRGRRDRTDEHLRRARELVDAAAPSPAKARVLGNVSRYLILGGNLASLLFEPGDLRRSHELRGEAIRVGERFGKAYFVRFARGALISRDFFAGRWDEYLRSAAAFLAESARAGGAYQDVYMLTFGALVKLARDEEAAAQEDALRGLGLAREAGDPQAVVPARTTLAVVEHELGRTPEAAGHVRSALAGERGAFASELAQVGLVADRLGIEDDLARAVSQMLASRWRTALERALERDYGGAAAVLGEIGDRPGEAYARLRAGEKLAADGRRPEAEEQLERALMFYRSVGATRCLRQAQRLLERAA